jgi:4'-phosphopantetheinyl transferase
MHYAIGNIEDYQNVSVFEKKFNSLSDYRKKKVSEKKQRQNQLQSLVGGILLQKLLADNYDLDEKSLLYQENNDGKAYINSDNNIFFNISHSEHLVACAVSENQIGIDIEKFRKINFDIAERFFHKDELAFLKSISLKKEREEIFFHIWTQKEAYAKCVGKSLLSIIENFNSLEITASQYLFNNHSFQFHNQLIGNDELYSLSICEQI